MADPQTIYDVLHNASSSNPAPSNKIIITGGGGAVGPNSVFWDYLAVTYPSSAQEVYTFKTGGSSGTVVATATVDYTDSTKESLLDVAWT